MSDTMIVVEVLSQRSMLGVQSENRVSAIQ
jgi:hypothetical protein